MKDTQTISLKNVRNRVNNECGVVGEAQESINLREIDDSLISIGQSPTLFTLPEGARLLFNDIRDKKEYFIISSGLSLRLYALRQNNEITILDQEICQLPGYAQKVINSGNFLMIYTNMGKVMLHYRGEYYERLDINNAIPKIVLSQGETVVAAEKLQSYQFKGTYTHWEAPLDDMDIKEIRKSMFTAYNAMCVTAKNKGRFVQPIMARYMVRMWDNSILFASAPVIVGNGMQGIEEIKREVTVSGSNFSTLSEGELALNSFGIAMTAIKGIGLEYDGLIKAIEVYYAEAPDPIIPESMFYKCETTQTGTRKYYMTANLGHEALPTFGEELANCDNWKLIARITDLEILNLNIIRGAGIEKCMDNGGGTLNKNRFICYEKGLYCENIKAERLTSIITNISKNIIPNTVINHAGKVYCGGGKNILENKWDPLSSFIPEFEEMVANYYVALKLKTENGERKIVTTYRAEDSCTAFSPLLSFPFPNAVEAQIMMLRDGKTHVLNLELKCSNNEEFSYYVAPDLLPLHMDIDEEASYIIPAEFNTIEDSDNALRTFVAGNPFAMESLQQIGDGRINGIAFALRPVTTNIFGRFPLYIFTSKGIFAVSTEKSANIPRCIDTKCVETQDMLVNTSYGVMFASNNNLYVLDGAKCKSLAQNVEIECLRWNEKIEELWSIAENGDVKVFNTVGRYFARSGNLVKFINNLIAVSPQREVFDFDIEENMPLSVNYLSQPFSCNKMIKEISWNLFGTNMDLRLTLYGNNGSNCHGDTISRITVSGNLNAPLTIPLHSSYYRTLRIEITGTINHDTLLREVIIK